MTLEEKTIREDMNSLLDKMKGITNKAKEENRRLTAEEAEEHKGYAEEAKELYLNLQVLENEEKLEDQMVGAALTATNQAVNGALDKPTDQPAQGISPAKNSREKELRAKTGKIFSLLASKKGSEAERLNKITELQKELAKNGHYGQQYQNNVDAFSTLTDADGGIFLPETVSDMIFDAADENGVFSQHGLRFPMSPGDGRQKLPNLLGDLTFYAVNEGSEAKASKLTFSAVVLEEQKWMTYIPWTSEMDDTKGEMLFAIVVRKLGEALARMRDDAVVNADGTSDYHNLKGLDTLSNDSDETHVRRSTAATGNTSFSAIDPDDFLNATLDVSKRMRERGRFVLDPDWRVYLKQMKDANNIPYYRGSEGVVSVDNGQYSIHGYPVEFSDSIPSTDGTSKTYGVFYVPEYYAFADNGNFAVEQFNTGSIPDTDGTSDAINLLSQDMKAARVKTWFDFVLSTLTYTEGGTAKGAFTVLETAAS